MHDKCSYKVKANNVITYVKRDDLGKDANTHSIKVLDKETSRDSDSNEDGRGKLTATATVRHRRSKKVVPTAEDMQPHRMNRILNRCQQAELYWAPSHEEDNCAVVDNMSMDDGNFQVTKLKGQGNPRNSFYHDNVDHRKTVWNGPQYHGHGDHYSSTSNGPRKSEYHRGSNYSEPHYAGSLTPSPSLDGSENRYNLHQKSRDNTPWASATSRSVDGAYYNGNHEHSHHRPAHAHDDYHHQPSYSAHEDHHHRPTHGHEDHHHRPTHPAHDDHHRGSKAPQETLPCIALCCCCRLAQLQQGGEPCCLGLRLSADHAHDRFHQHGHPRHHEETHRASHGTQSDPSHYAHHASYAHHDHPHPEHVKKESNARHHEDRHSQYGDYDSDHHSLHGEHYNREHHRKNHATHPDGHHDYSDHLYDHGSHHGEGHSPHGEHYNREHHRKIHAPRPDGYHDYPDHPYDHGHHHGEGHSPHGEHYNREHHRKSEAPHPGGYHDYPDHPYDHGHHHGEGHSPQGEHHRTSNYPDHYDLDYSKSRHPQFGDDWRSHEELLSQGYTFDQGTDCPPLSKMPPDDSCQANGCCLPYLVTSCTIHGDVSGDQSKKGTTENCNNTTNSCSDQLQCPRAAEAPVVWNPKNTQDECNHCYDLCDAQNEWQQEPITSRPSDEVASEEREQTRILIRPFQEPQHCASSVELVQSPTKNGFRVKSYMNGITPSPRPNQKTLSQVPKAAQPPYHCYAGQGRQVSPKAARAQVLTTCCPRDPAAATGCKNAQEKNWNEMTIKVSTRQKPSECQPKNSTLIKVNTKRYPS